MDGGAWWAAVHGVAKSRTRLSDFPFTFRFYALEKEMATHSSTLAWKIPSMEEPCGPQSMDGFGPISTYFSYFLVGSLVTFNIHKHVFLK